MKEYRATLTINVFIPAESEEDVVSILEDMEIVFKDDKGHFDSNLIDWEIEEVVD